MGIKDNPSPEQLHSHLINKHGLPSEGPWESEQLGGEQV